MYVLVDRNYPEGNFGKLVHTPYKLNCYLRYTEYVDLAQTIEMLSLHVKNMRS